VGGPVSLEPLESSDDDSVGKMMVHHATGAGKHPAEAGGKSAPLPLQPRFKQIESDAGAGNYPAGSQPPPRRVPVRRVVDKKLGPGKAAADKMIKTEKKALEATKGMSREAQEMNVSQLALMATRDRYAGTSATGEEGARLLGGVAGTGIGLSEKTEDVALVGGLEEQIKFSQQRLQELEQAKRDKIRRQKERRAEKESERRRRRREERAAARAVDHADAELDGNEGGDGRSEDDDDSDVDEFGEPTDQKKLRAAAARDPAVAEARRRERRLRRDVDRVGWTKPDEYAESLASKGAIEPPGANDRSGIQATAGGARSRAVVLHRSAEADGLPEIGSSARSLPSPGGKKASLTPSGSLPVLGNAIAGGVAGPRTASIPWVTRRDRKRWQARGEALPAGDVISAARKAASERKRVDALGRSADAAVVRSVTGKLLRDGEMAQFASLEAAKAQQDAWALVPSHAVAASVEAELRRKGVLRNEEVAFEAAPGSSQFGGYSAGGGALVPTSMGTRERLFALGTAAAKGGALGGTAQRLPLSGSVLQEPKGFGVSGVVTPRTALKHSLLLRRFGPIGQEGKEYTRDELRQIAKGEVSDSPPPPDTTGDRGLDKAKLSKGGSGRGFVQQRPMPAGLEEDDVDPYWEEYQRRTREPWWDMSFGGLERAKHSGVIRAVQGQEDVGVVGGAIGADVVEKALERRGVRFADDASAPGWKAQEGWKFDAAQFGGKHNYRDIERSVDADMRGYAEWAPPTELRDLRGECVVQTVLSRNMGLAVTAGGDVFVWGANPSGAHCIGADGSFKPFPTLVDSREMLGLPPGGRIVSASSGTLHTALVTDQGELLVAGASSMGRLGLGGIRAYGPPLFRSANQGRLTGSAWSGGNLSGMQVTEAGRAEAAEAYIPPNVTVPVPVPFFSIAAAAAAGKLAMRRRVLRVSCGAAHTLAITDKGVYAWGSGAGGRLGIGRPRAAADHGERDADSLAKAGTRSSAPVAVKSTLDRALPTLIKALQGEIVLDICAAAFHSLFLVQVPPLQEGGWVFSCGTGTVGQLGLLDATTCWEPRAVDSLVEKNVVAVEIAAGSYHNAALSTEGEVWTWGSAAGNCLGRPAQLSAAGYPAFTPLPGRVEGMREFGVGPAISIACGDRCTFIVTAPYNPQGWPEWKQREMTTIDGARERRSAVMQKLLQDEAEDRYRLALERAKLEQQRIHQLNRTRPLCSLAPPLAEGAVAPQSKGLFAALSSRTGREMDQDNEEREDRLMTGTIDQAGFGTKNLPKGALSSRTDGSTTGRGGGIACTGFIPRLFAQEVCDVCGHHRRHHTLLRRVPPLEELAQMFLQQIHEEEEDLAAAQYTASGRDMPSSARSSGRRSNPGRYASPL
jgi:alpha-tubulin suppressor-like RCC1 family protein